MSAHMLHPQGQRSHFDISRGIAALGRGGDNTLVHMSNKELEGLQRLAMAHGGTLTTNPHTGLPEAGALATILPVVAGGILAMTGVGAVADAAIVGAGTGLITKNWKEGVAAGIGAYGGASLASGLAGIGSSGASTAAATDTGAAAGAGSNAATGATAYGTDANVMASPLTQTTTSGITGATTGGGAAATSGAGSSGQIVMSGVGKAGQPIYTTQAAQQAAAETASRRAAEQAAAHSLSSAGPSGFTNYATNVGGGVKALAGEGSGTSGQAWGDLINNSGKLGLAATTAPAMYQSYENSTQIPSTPTGPYYTTRYDQGKQNPYSYIPGQMPIIGQGYSPPTQAGIYSGGGRVHHYATGMEVNGMPPASALNAALTPPPNTNAASDAPTFMPAPANSPNPTTLQQPYNPRMAWYYQGLMQPPSRGVQQSQAPHSAPNPSAWDNYLANLNQSVQAPLPANQSPVQGYGTPPGGQVTIGGGGLEHNPMGEYARGGITSLGHYSDGGQYLKGPGDGMADKIPAAIGGIKPQPAALSDSEFVIPADVVSHLGNGSSDAGAKKLYQMMDRVRAARTGKQAQAPKINANKYMPT